MLGDGIGCRLWLLQGLKTLVSNADDPLHEIRETRIRILTFQGLGLRV